MKIAIDASQVVYHGTGVAKYTQELISNLLEIDKENEYLIYGLSWGRKNLLSFFFHSLQKKHLSNASFKIIPLSLSIGSLLWNSNHIISIDKLLGKIDILHSSDWIQPKTEAKKVTTVHDLIIYKYPQYFHPQIISTQKKRLSWVIKECDILISDSIATKSDLVKILGADPVKVHVVYPGVGKEFFVREKKEVERIRKKYALSDNFILSVGKLEPRKNLKNVLEAFKKFSSSSHSAFKNDSPELVVAGSAGWGDELKVKKNVRFLGFVENEDLPLLYSAASFFIYPSFYEGFGLPVVEAMACGCPVITSDKGSLREVAGNNALFVNPFSVDDIAEKMKKLSNNQSLKDDLSEKGKLNATKFSWRKTAKNVLKIYNNFRKKYL